MSEAARQTWTVLDVLRWTTERFTRASLESPRLDAELLLAHALGVERIRLYVDFAKPLSPEELLAFRQLVRRRLRFEPVAYLIGYREFWSMRLEVCPGVLVPRPETETLVEAALRWAARREALTIVDVGTGSGAIAIALAKELPGAQVVAVEREAPALRVAARNIGRLAPAIALVQGSLLGAFAAESCDLVVANLPYIPQSGEASLPPDVREWEPASALFGGTDGLDLVRELVPEAAKVLRPAGLLLLELDSVQVDAVAALCAASGLVGAAILRDLAGLPRIVSVQRAG